MVVVLTEVSAERPPPVRNLRTALFDGRIQQVRSGRESMRSSLRIGAVIEAN